MSGVLRSGVRRALVGTKLMMHFHWRPFPERRGLLEARGFYFSLRHTRKFLTGGGFIPQEEVIETKKKIDSVGEKIEKLQSKIEHLESEIDRLEEMEFTKLSQAKQKVLQDEVGFEKWRMDEKNKLQDILKALQDEKNKLQDEKNKLHDKENILLKQAGPVVKVDRPSFFIPKPTDDLSKLEQAWNKYLRGEPEVDEEAQQFLQALTRARVVTHDELRLSLREEPVSGGSGQRRTEVEVHNMKGEKASWPSMKEGEIGVTKVVWDIKETEEESEDDVSKPSDARDIMADSLHVVTLPHPILGPPDNAISRRVLFFRNLDVALMKECEKVPRNLLIGSPGISKSWHLWKALVCYANEDLCRMFLPDSEKSKPRAVAFVANEIRVFFFSSKDKWQQASAHISTSDITYNLVEGLCQLPNAMALYDKRDGVVPGTMYRVPLLASFSPDESRYKEYAKQMNVKKRYVSCPTKFEVAATVSCLEHYGGLGECPDSAEAMRRFDELGPFLRPITHLSSKEFSTQIALRNELIQQMIPKTVEATLIKSIILETEMKSPLSHRLARFHTPNAKDGDFLTTVLKYASPGARAALKAHCAQVEIKDLQTEMVRFENRSVIQLSEMERAKRTQEELIRRYVSSIPCKWDIVQSKREKQGDPKILGSMRFKNERVDRDRRTVAQMKTGTLYIPWNTNYPFVDMLFVEHDGGLVDSNFRVVYAVQATMQNKHPKSAISFWNFYRKELGLRTKEEKDGMAESDKVIVLMAVKRKDALSYVEGRSSVYWKGLPPDKECEVVEFCVMVAHPEYLPDETSYCDLLKTTKISAAR